MEENLNNYKECTNNEEKIAKNITSYELEKEKEFVNLIAEMIVDIAFKNVYEKGN